jgi:hypothetical protein
MKGVNEVAKAMCAGAGIVSINCLANKFGEEGLSTLLASIKDTSVRSLCGLIEGQTVAEFSGQNLGPIDCKIMAAEFAFQGFIAGVKVINLSGCPLTGAIYEDGEWYDIDSDMAGFVALCGVLGKLHEVNLSNCGLGPSSAGELAKAVSSAEAAVNSITVDSTGDMPNQYGDTQSGGPKPYTLTVGEETIDLSSKNLGSADVNLLVAWMHRPEVSAVIEALAIGANPIGTEGGNILIEAIQSSTLKTIDIGKPLPLQGKYESDTADLADSGMGPGQVAILAWWLTTDAAAAITSANLLHNPLGEGIHEIIEVFEQKEQLRTLCGFEEGIKEIDWKDSKKGPTEILLLAADLRACRAIAVLASMTISGVFTPVTTPYYYQLPISLDTFILVIQLA